MARFSLNLFFIPVCCTWIRSLMCRHTDAFYYKLFLVKSCTTPDVNCSTPPLKGGGGWSWTYNRKWSFFWLLRGFVNSPIPDITPPPPSLCLSVWTCALACVARSSVTRPTSDVGSVIRPDCFRFGSRCLSSPSLHHPALISSIETLQSISTWSPLMSSRNVMKVAANALIKVLLACEKIKASQSSLPSKHTLKKRKKCNFSHSSDKGQTSFSCDFL